MKNDKINTKKCSKKIIKKNILNKKQKEQKAITLVTLAITIVIMLILVGVTIIAVVNGGLIGNAGKAAKEAKLAETEEQLKLDILTLQTDITSLGGNGISIEQIKDIIKKYGTLDADGDTIKTKNGNLSLKEILGKKVIIGDGLTPTQREKITVLEKQVVEIRNSTGKGRILH